jgi:hypothetical protein
MVLPRGNMDLFSRVGEPQQDKQKNTQTPTNIATGDLFRVFFGVAVLQL